MSSSSSMWHPNAASGVNATKIQAYVPAAVALVIGVAVLIIGILLLMRSLDEGDIDQVVKKVSSTNGFRGSIASFGLTLGTTSTGLLKGPGLNIAADTDVTSHQLAGFDNLNPGTIITDQDTILSASEKGLLLNVNPLIGLTSSTGPVQATDTVFVAACKIKGQCDNLQSWFSITEAKTFGPSDYVPLWTNESTNGTNVIPSNIIQPGLTYNLYVAGKVYGPSDPLVDPESIEFQLYFGSTIFTSVVSQDRAVFDPVNGWNFNIVFALGFISTTQATLTSTMNFYDPGTDAFVTPPTQITSSTETTSYEASLENEIVLYGRTNSTTGHSDAHVSYSITSAVFYPTIGVMTV